MTNAEVLDKLLSILRNVAPGIKINSEQVDVDLSDLGYDSLDISSITLEIEETFSVSVSDEELETLDTLNDFLQFLKVRLN